MVIATIMAAAKLILVIICLAPSCSPPSYRAAAQSGTVIPKTG